MINKNGFIDRLNALDLELGAINIKIKLYVAGGMALSVLGIIERSTEDIDAFKTTNKKIEKILNEYDINFEVSNIVKDNSFKKFSSTPPEFDIFENIELYIVDSTYLFVLKCLAIISPNRSESKKNVDLDDIKNMIDHIDKNDIEKIINSLALKSLNEYEVKYLKEEVNKWL